MKNKKGILRILEATIAIIIVISFLVITQIKNIPIQEEDYTERAQSVIEEMSQNLTLRNEILESEEGIIHEGIIFDFVRLRIPESYLEFRIKICGEIDQICALDRYVGDNVYTSERVIVSDIEDSTFQNKKIKIFIWRDDEN